MSYRVLHICNKVVPPEKSCGGLNRMLCWLAEEQFKNGYQVFIGSPKGWSTSYFNFVDLKGVDSYTSLVGSLPKNIDFIFYHGGYDFIAEDIKSIGIPFISVHHGTCSDGLKIINPVFVSKSHAKMHGHERFVYNGIPSPIHDYSEKNKDYLLFLGKVNRSKKGAKDAVRAAIRTKQRIVVAGGRKLDLPHTWFSWHPLVDPVGYIDGQRKIDIIKSAKALLVPIKWEEPFGLTIVEALSYGTPVIAYNRGAAPELISHGVNGFLCNSLEEMVDAIPQVSSILPSNCRNSYQNNFTVEIMFKSYHTLIEHVVSRWPLFW